MRVAILGTGKMGAAIARRLNSTGHQVTLWNRTRARAEAVGVGVVAATPAEAVKDVEVVISIMTDAKAVKKVYLGENGAASAARGKVFVEMSTAGPEINQEVARAVESFVEAPVLGSVGAMESGQGVLLAAGKPDDVDRAREVLQAIGEVRYIGELGSAAALKLIANSMLAGVYALSAELLAAGETAGLKTDDAWAVLTRIAPLLNQRKAGFVEHRYEPVTFAMRDAVKDLTLATKLFNRLHASTPMVDTTKVLFERAARSAGDLEMSAIATLYEKQPV